MADDTPDDSAAPDYQGSLETARAAGYSWGDIQGHIAQSTAEASDVGYSQDEIDQHLGFTDPTDFEQRIRNSWAKQMAVDPTTLQGLSSTDPTIDLSAHPQMANDYSQALLAGEVKGPQDFAYRYGAAALDAASDAHGATIDDTHKAAVATASATLAQTLPSREDLADATLAVSGEFGEDIDPAAARQNLLDHWADTGTMPVDAAQDPELASQLVAPPAAPPAPVYPATLEELQQPGRDAIEAVGLATSTELMGTPGHDTIPDVLTDFASDIAGYHGAMLIGKYVIAPLARIAWDKLGEIPTWLRGAADQAPVKTTDLTAPIEEATQTLTSRQAAAQAEAAAPIHEAAANLAIASDAERAVAKEPIVTEPGAPPSTAEADRSQAQELLPAYDAAKGWYQTFADVLRDDNGALTLRTPENQQFHDAFAESRDIAQRILIPSLAAGVKDDNLLARQLDVFQRDIAPHVNEFADAARNSDGQGMINSTIGNFIGYVENRNWGGSLGNSKLAPLADAMANVAAQGYAKMQGAVNDGLIDTASYLENYYKHLWKDPSGPNWNSLVSRFGGGKQGSPSFLRQRELPTMYDGFKLGMSPMFDNPIQQVQYGEHLRSHYLNALDAIRQAKDLDQAYHAFEPRDRGDIPLNGVKSEQGTGIPGPVLRLYGKPGFARPYNNMLSIGMNAHPVGASTYQKLLWAGNMSTAIKLVWPMFHAHVLAIGSMASGLAEAMENAARGEFTDALKSAGLIGPGHLALGFRSIYRYNRNVADPVLDLLTSAGLRVLPRQAIYNAGPESLAKTAARGGLAPFRGQWDVAGGFQEILRTIGRDIEEVGGDPRVEGTLYTIARAPDRALIQLPLKELGRVMQTVSSPFFDHVVPALKTGAAYSRLQSWLKANPYATDEAKWFQARQITRDVENRMGELNQDALFGPKTAKQLANLSMVSTGWMYGSYRGFLGAIGFDIERGGPQGRFLLGKVTWSPTLANSLAAGLVSFGMINTVQQYIHDGTFPWQTDTPFRDLMNFRNGAGGRGMIPAEYKELFDMAKVVLTSVYSPKDMVPTAADYLLGKLNPWWQALRGTITGHDGMGKSVYDRPGGWPAYIHDTFQPIIADQITNLKPGFTMLDAYIGNRPAARWITNWDDYVAGLDRGHARAEKQELYRAGQAPERAAPQPRYRPPSKTYQNFEYGLSPAPTHSRHRQ